MKQIDASTVHVKRCSFISVTHRCKANNLYIALNMLLQTKLFAKKACH